MRAKGNLPEEMIHYHMPAPILSLFYSVGHLRSFAIRPGWCPSSFQQEEGTDKKACAKRVNDYWMNGCKETYDYVVKVHNSTITGAKVTEPFDDRVQAKAYIKAQKERFKKEELAQLEGMSCKLGGGLRG